MRTLIEASAGTGKTHQIVKRVVERVRSGTPLHRILVVTFTDAAAAELRDRVHARLIEDGSEAANTALAAFDRATITTIHGFCKGVIAQYAALCGVAEDVELVSDAAVIRGVVADFWVRETHDQPQTVKVLGGAKLDPAKLTALAERALRHTDATIIGAGRPEVECLRRLVEWARTEVPRRLRAANQITFDGLLRIVRDAVDGPLKEALAARFDCVYIDEFQDTDPVQWAIFDTLFGAKLTLIGDPKQSIYGFRQADVRTYLEAGRGARRELLDVNFRSDPRLVQAVDRLFARPGAFTEPPLSYEPVKAHHEERVIGARAAPLTLRFFSRPEGSVRFSASAATERVARDVAKDIADSLSAGIIVDVTGSGRPLQARDCAVLVRSHQQAEAVRAALSEVNLASVVRSPESVFRTDAAGEFARILAAIAEPNSTSGVKSALATRLVGVDASGLVSLDAAAWGRWAERLQDWGQVWRERGPLGLLYVLLTDLDGYSRLLAQFGGARYLTDLRQLAERLQTEPFADGVSRPGQIEWLRAAATRQPDSAERLQLEDDGDAVVIATIHASKGLAYGFVWCPFAWTLQQLHRDERRAPIYHLPDGQCVLNLAPDSAAIVRAEQEARGEATRLLYVAMTRARHQLVLHWGAGEGYEQSPLTRLLAPEMRLRNLDDDGLFEWLGSHRSDGLIEVERAGETQVVPVIPALAPTLGTLSLPARSHDLAWRRTSFSGLTRDAPHGGTLAVGELDLTLIGEVPLAHFAGGAQIGTFIHAVLEHADFGDPESVALQVDIAAQQHGVADPQDVLKLALQTVVETPLSTGRANRSEPFSLADVSRSERIDELEFYLPVGGGFGTGEAVTVAALAQVLRAHPGPGLPSIYPDHLEQLAAAPFRGFLSGAIDLVFQRGGRWYLADYKSNHLGTRFADYAPPQLAFAMDRAHYVLQYHLYTLALHRYLKWRLPDYDYDAHFGGVYYLFLRGMSPALGPAAGVYFDRPPKALIEGWSALFGGER